MRRTTVGGSFQSDYNVKAISFDGIDENLGADTYASSLIFDAPMSLSFWYKPGFSHLTTNSVIWTATSDPEIAAYRCFIGYGPVTGSLTNEVLTVVRGSSAIGFTDASSAPYLNLWNHFVVTFTGTTNNFYHNGVLKTSVIGSSTAQNGDYGDGTPPASKNIFQWLYRPASSGYGEGILDEPAIYNKVLSGAEVLEIYNAGNPDDLNSFASAANLVGWWRNGDGAGDAIDGTLGNNPLNRIYDQSGNGYDMTPGPTMTSANIVNDAP